MIASNNNKVEQPKVSQGVKNIPKPNQGSSSVGNNSTSQNNNVQNNNSNVNSSLKK